MTILHIGGRSSPLGSSIPLDFDLEYVGARIFGDDDSSFTTFTYEFNLNQLRIR